MKMLVSINPEHVAKILSGDKKYEYRTKAAKRNPGSMVIYETAPVKKVVAEAEIREIIGLPPEELWEKTKSQSGISREFFDSYFRGREIAYAYRLGEVTAYDAPMELGSYGIESAPQSFAYLND